MVPTLSPQNSGSPMGYYRTLQQPPPQQQTPTDFGLPSDSGGGDLAWNPSGLQTALQRLRGLKGQLIAGQINSADYLQQAQSLVQQSSNIVGTIAGQGGKAANTVNPLWQQIQNENFAKADQGKWIASLPVNEQEYAALPDSAKPTADQINQGLVPTSALPGNVGLNTLIGQQQQKQQGLASQALQGIRSSYDDYSNNAIKNLTQQLTTGQPGEQLRQTYNGLGLLNSGAFSEGLANTISQNSLGIMGQEQNFLNNIMGENYQNLSGLQTGGLQRQFSLEDFYNNADLQRELSDNQNNAYMSALNQQKQNPWTQLGLGAAGGLFQGIGQRIGGH